MRVFALLVSWILLPFVVVFGQETEHETEEVIVVNTHNQQTQYTLNNQRITGKLATDVGQLLLLFPGIQVKSYGGLGGLKTANFRAIGSGHTSVVIDFQQASSSQTGATDFSAIPVDFVKTIRLVQQASTAVELPIQSKLAGAIIAIETKHSTSEKKEPTCIGLQVGSFGLIEGTIFTAFQHNHCRFSASWKGRSANGNYPFRYLNGATWMEETRKNGDLHEQYGTIQWSYLPSKKYNLSFQLNENTYRKGLPGAVVFYNETAQQRLNGNLINGFVRQSFRFQKWDIQQNSGYTLNYLQYLDSSYLNSQGFLDNRYHSAQFDIELQACRKWENGWKLLGGSQYRNEALNASTLYQHPNRISFNSIVGATYHQLGLFSLQIGHQIVQDGKTNRSFFLPSIDWNFRLNGRQQLGFALKQTIRLPTFNELYYQQIGNTSLLPEKVALGTLRHFISLTKPVYQWQSTIQLYFGEIANKILAIPTKNMFIWSIQNIGRVRSYGLECAQHISIPISRCKLEFHLNYTFQRLSDITNKSNTNYRSQLSYTPKHSGTLEIAVQTKKMRWYALGTYQGGRYALNENIPANYLSSFFLIDLGGSYSFPIKQSTGTVRLTLQNLTNNYYSYIRYFVMPGIHFNTAFTYAF